MSQDKAYWISHKPCLYPYSDIEMLTLDDLIYYSKLIDQNITVKRGFNTDGASVPWLFQWKFKPFDNRTIRSVILHDYLYVLHDYDPTFTMDRKMADDILLESLVAESWTNAKMYYDASMIFGGPLWQLKKPRTDVTEWINIVKNGSELDLDNYISHIIHG